MEGLEPSTTPFQGEYAAAALHSVKLLNLAGIEGLEPYRMDSESTALPVMLYS